MSYPNDPRRRFPPHRPAPPTVQRPRPPHPSHSEPTAPHEYPDYPYGTYPPQQPGYPYYPQQPPPRRRPPRMRRRGPGCFSVLFRVAFALTLFVILFTCLFGSLYVMAPPPRTNILILGLDSRPGEGMVVRSDTIILATVDPDQPYVGMLSIPRDLWVEVPGYGANRINSAHIMGENEYEGGGLDLAVQTIEQNFRVPVHRTVRLNFEAFVAIVDAAGGVTIDVPESFIDYEYPTPDYGTMVVEFEAGEQHMDGERALQYARIRHGSSDFARAARQQQVISALVRQLVAPRNWWRLPAVYLAFQQNVETDLTLIDAVLLGPAMLWVGPDGIDRQVISQAMAPSTNIEGADVLTPLWDAINPLLDTMFHR